MNIIANIARSCGAAETKPVTPIAATGDVIVTACGTAVLRVVVPTTASQYALVARCGALRVCHATCGIFIKPVRAPLPHVPVHVAQSPGIGPILADRRGFGKVRTFS